MSDLRERLERESLRVTLSPGAEDRMFERRERRDRRRRVGTVVFALALLVGIVAVVLTALPRDHVRPATPVPADALQGEWVATSTCDEMVQAVERAQVNAQLEKFWRRAQAQALGSDDPEDPCAGNPAPVAYRFQFADGHLRIFDPPTGREGFAGEYELEGDVLKVRDREGDNIVGTYRVAYRLDGDTLSFDLLGRGGKDPFFIGAWESGELQRA